MTLFRLVRITPTGLFWKTKKQTNTVRYIINVYFQSDWKIIQALKVLSKNIKRTEKSLEKGWTGGSREGVKESVISMDRLILA